jgi:hypothetical protein
MSPKLFTFQWNLMRFPPRCRYFVSSTRKDREFTNKACDLIGLTNRPFRKTTDECTQGLRSFSRHNLRILKEDNWGKFVVAEVRSD